MSDKEKRRHLSVSGAEYERIKQAALERRVSMSKLVEQATADVGDEDGKAK